MRKRFLLLALLPALFGGGANGQTWDLACTDDHQYAGLGSGGTARPWFDIENTGNHFNLDCNGSGSYMHVHCWDGDSAAIAWLEDAENQSWTASGSTFIVTPASGVVEDADIVLRYNNGDLQVVVFFVFIALNGNRTPVASLYNFSGCQDGSFSHTYTLSPVAANQTDVHSPNIDISDNDDVVITWENDGSIYGMTLTVGATTLSTNSLVTVASAGGGYEYENPDITINGNSDVVSVTYVGVYFGGQDLYINQGSLTNFSGGNIGGASTLTSISTAEDFSAPRITSPISTFSCPGSTCDDDYVVVVRYTDGSVWRIWAYGMLDGSTTSNNEVNDDASSPSIDCYENDKPVVAWTEDGIQVGWELWGADGGCGSLVSGAGQCGGPNGPAPAAPVSDHFIIQHLDYDLAERTGGAYEDSYSVFNRWLSSLQFVHPSLSEGEGSVGQSLVLGTVFFVDNLVCCSTIPLVVYKENPFIEWHLKRGTDQGYPVLIDALVYPNPFANRIVVGADEIGTGIHLATVKDVIGRSYPLELATDHESRTVIDFPASMSMSPGTYVLTLYWTDSKRSFMIAKGD